MGGRWRCMGWRGVGNKASFELSGLGAVRQRVCGGPGGGKGLIELSSLNKTVLEIGVGCGHVGRRGVGKASLNLTRITELSALGAVRQQGLDEGSVWMRGVAGKGLIESH